MIWHYADENVTFYMRAGGISTWYRWLLKEWKSYCLLVGENVLWSMAKMYTAISDIDTLQAAVKSDLVFKCDIS